MVVVSLVYIVLGSLVLFVARWYSFRSARTEALAIVRIASFVANGSGDISKLGRGIARINFVQSLVYVADRVDINSREPLRVIVRYYNIEAFLVNRAARSCSDSQRAYYLALLSRLPLSCGVLSEVERFLTDAFERVRFYALMALFSCSPYRAIAVLEQSDWRLSRRDVAELLTLISRGCCPLPYMPLLLSENYNLQLLGIHLVRRFAITESRAQILAIVRCGNSELRDDALETLVSLGEQERGYNCVLI